MYIDTLTIKVNDSVRTYTPRATLLDCATPEQLMAALNDRNKVSGIPIELLETVCMVHKTMDTVVQRAALDKTFWEGIALA